MGDAAVKDWFNRYCEEDPSWIGDFKDLIAGKSPLKYALLGQFASPMMEFLDHVVSLRGQCESPIETAFLDALFKWAPMHGMPVVYEPNDLFEATKGQAPSQGLVIEPQFKIALSKAYRVDFMLMTQSRLDRKTRKLIVECDGHDYHERTKEQARKDKSRDREMTAAGYTIMRFTGSEIHKSADDCADQVAAYLTRHK
jgi:very-short-patch-repair endonuclease